ncbi:MAG TPA: MAPEG family protein [Candidatus Margulisiibacteriota bacterium]|nr:MAPEG family protein [Candidatus Margulisiibacteriota bacterium]
MTTDLTMLVATAVLCLLNPMVYLAAEMITPGGLEWGLSNRAQAFTLPEWAARAKRAHLNLIENLAPFAILVLAAHVGGKANAMTALGAQIFFWARLAYVGVYTAGITGVRTAVFFLATAGEVLILLQLLR